MRRGYEAGEATETPAIVDTLWKQTGHECENKKTERK